MRRGFFRLGLLALAVLPTAYGVAIYQTQDLPPIPVWGWALLLAAVLLLVFARNKDEVIRHHLPH